MGLVFSFKVIKNACSYFLYSIDRFSAFIVVENWDYKNVLPNGALT